MVGAEVPAGLVLLGVNHANYFVVHLDWSGEYGWPRVLRCLTVGGDGDRGATVEHAAHDIPVIRHFGPRPVHNRDAAVILDGPDRHILRFAREEQDAARSRRVGDRAQNDVGHALLVRRPRQRAQELMRADRVDPSRPGRKVASEEPGVLAREQVGAHRETQIQPTLVRRPQHVFAKRRSPGVGVEGGGLLVGIRADHWKLAFLGQPDRLVQVALCLCVLSARSCPRPLNQYVRCRVVFRCASAQVLCNASACCTKRTVERSRGAHRIMLRAPIM